VVCGCGLRVNCRACSVSVRVLRYILSRGHIDIVLQCVAVCCCRENCGACSVFVCTLRYISSRTYPLELIDRYSVASMLRCVVAG